MINETLHHNFNNKIDSVYTLMIKTETSVTIQCNTCKMKIIFGKNYENEFIYLIYNNTHFVNEDRIIYCIENEIESCHTMIINNILQ